MRQLHFEFDSDREPTPPDPEFYGYDDEGHPIYEVTVEMAERISELFDRLNAEPGCPIPRSPR